MANVKKKLKNHTYRKNLLRKQGIFLSIKSHKPHEDTMVQWKIRWVGEGDYLP